MHTDRIRERALEALDNTKRGERKADSAVVCDPDNVAAPVSTGAKPPLSQVEQERADDEGMVRLDKE